MGKVYEVENKHTNYVENVELDRYLATRTKKQCIDLFLHHIGFTWRERTKGFDVAGPINRLQVEGYK